MNENNSNKKLFLNSQKPFYSTFNPSDESRMKFDAGTESKEWAPDSFIEDSEIRWWDHCWIRTKLLYTAMTHAICRYLYFMGPGLLVCIAYIDPGNIEADIELGAKTRYSLLWVLLLSTIMGYVFQLTSLNLGLATGKHLAQHCHDGYGKKMRIFLWVMTEIAIIGSDIQEVLGSAIALRILFGNRMPLWVGTLLSVMGTMFLLFIEQIGARHLELFFAFLISIMGGTFGIQYFVRLPPQIEVLKGILVPWIPAGAMQQAVATIGAVIMPHNLFLHSALVLSRRVDRRSKVEVKEAVIFNMVESGVALFLSFFINLFVVSTFSHLDYDKCNLKRGDVGLVNGGECLAANSGPWALYVWAIGLLASGQSSTCTGTYTGQFVMQGFIKLHIPRWQRAMFTRLLVLVPTLFVALYAAQNSVKDIQEHLNILQSIQLPFALLPLIKFTRHKKLLRSTTVQKIVTLILIVSSILILLANAFLIGQYLPTQLGDSFTKIKLITLYILLFFYCSSICFLIRDSYNFVPFNLDEEIN